MAAPTDKEPLLQEAGAPQAASSEKRNEFLKYGSLGFLILQNSSQ